MSERAHGSRTKYVHDGCRCFPCRLANADYARTCWQRNESPGSWRTHRLNGAYLPTWIVRDQATGEEAFRTADRAAARRRRDILNRAAERASGEEPLWASPQTEAKVREFLGWLRREGVGLRRVSAVTGISRARLQEIAAGRATRKGRPEQRRLRHETADRILLLSVTRARGALVPAGETWQLLDGLVAAGHTKSAIAKALGYRGRGIPIGHTQVRKSTAARIRALARQLGVLEGRAA